tara:strand:+ start:1513 stop:2049 length:537 start_codon:yes stop_codon:yes gene_type:complete
MFKSPSKAKDAKINPLHLTHFLKLNAAIINAYSATDKNTLLADINTLEDGNLPGQKGANGKEIDKDGNPIGPAPGTRRYLQGCIGGYRNDYMVSFRKHLEGPKKKKRGAKGKGKGAKAPADTAEIVVTDITTHATEVLVELIKRLQKAEETPFDAVTVIETCQTALKIVANKMELVKK